MSKLAGLVVLLVACGPASRGTGTGVDGGNGGPDANHGGGDAPAGGGDAGSNGCGGLPNCYSVYAHSNTTLYQIDLTTKALQTIGPFNAPSTGSGSGGGSPDVITDIAVGPDGTIWAISETALYTASATDGHVTAKGSLAACGNRGVALTATPAGKIYEGDFKGAVCEIDITGATPVVKPPVTLSDSWALSGDLVAVGDGTVFGTLYKLTDQPGKATNLSNELGKIDLTTGAVTPLGATGSPKLFGVSFAAGKVIGFTHDGTGNVVAIDPVSGVGTPFAQFNTPGGSGGISFAGAGVNALVQIIQ